MLEFPERSQPRSAVRHVPLAGPAGLVPLPSKWHIQFGEPIPTDVLDRCQRAARSADVILVAGTSATVYPAAALPIEVLRRGGIA